MKDLPYKYIFLALRWEQDILNILKLTILDKQWVNQDNFKRSIKRCHCLAGFFKKGGGGASHGVYSPKSNLIK